MQSLSRRLARHQLNRRTSIIVFRRWHNAQSGSPTAFQGVTTAAAAAAAAAPVTTPALAVDVEYAHYLTNDGRHVSTPAWVAVVDHYCLLRLKTFVSTPVEDGARWIGGVSQAAVISAPALQTVLQQLQELAAGQLLLGHGLAKDLSALGWDHPEALRFDTMTHAAFCNKAGSSKNLKELAKEFLSQEIQQGQPALQDKGRGSQNPGRGRRKCQQPRQRGQQLLPPQQQQQQQQQGQAVLQAVQADSPSTSMPQSGLHDLQQQQHHQQQQQEQPSHPSAGPPQQQAGQQRLGHAERVSRSGHDPEEDAVAVMQLYQQVVFPSTYEGQVAIATAQLLAALRQQQLQADEVG